MNLIIEIIDGVAYALDRANEPFKACDSCVIGGWYDTAKCSKAKMCKLRSHNFYRHLTAEEREELIKAIGRGI